MSIRLLIMNAFADGRTIRATFTLAGALAERGHDVEIVSGSLESAFVALTGSDGDEVAA